MFVSAPSRIPSPSVSISCAERGVETAMEIASKKVVCLECIVINFLIRGIKITSNKRVPSISDLRIARRLTLRSFLDERWEMLTLE